MLSVALRCFMLIQRIPLSVSQEEMGVWLHEIFLAVEPVWEVSAYLFSPPFRTACYSPHIAVSALSSLLIQLLLGSQAKNILPERNGVVFILTEIIPAICFIACSAKSCVSTTEGATNSNSAVERSRGILEPKGQFLCKSIFKVKLLQVNKSVFVYLF